MAIVGAGPAGLSTALHLLAAAPARAARVVVLERERFPRDKICGGAIGARADVALERVGVRVDVPSVIVRGLSVVASSGALHRRLDGGEPIGRVVRRLEFDAALASAARSRGVRLEEGVRVEAVTVDEAAVCLTTSRGDVRARVVVGADGVGSAVRRAIGLSRGRLRAQVVEVDTPRVAADLAPDLLHFDLGDASLCGYSWDFATIVDGQELVCRGVYDLRLGDRDDVRPGVDPSARLAARLAASGVVVRSPFKRFAERGLDLHEAHARRRVLLVGEAAGIDPVLGEGIAQAILYGAVAGPYLARALDRGDVGFADWGRVLSRSRVGFDLAVRTRVARLVYGARTRATMERWITSSPALATSGMSWFAGRHVPRDRIAVAALDLARALRLRAWGREPRSAASR